MKLWRLSATLTLVFQLITNAQDFTIKLASTPCLPSRVYTHSLLYAEAEQFVYLAGHTDTSFDGQQYAGGNDAFLSKHYLNGTRIWSRIVGGPGNEFGGKVLQNPLTFNVFLFGQASSFAVDNQTSSGGSYDSLIVKFSPNGTKLFTRLSGTINADDVLDAFLDTQNQQWVLAGEYNNLFSLTVNDLNNGTLLKQFLFPASGGAAGIADIPGSTDCLVAGLAYTSFDGLTNAGGYDVLLSKMSYANGTRYWSRMWGSYSDEYANDVQYDLNSRRVFVTGVITSGGSLNGQPSFGNTDILLISTTDNGTYLWTRQFGTASDDLGFSLAIHQPTGTLFVVGSYNSYAYGFVSTFYQNGTTMSPMMLTVGRYFSDLTLVGSNFAYVADYNGLFVTLNISSPPVPIGATPFPTPRFVSQTTDTTMPTPPTTAITSATLIGTFVTPNSSSVSTLFHESSRSDSFSAATVVPTSNVIDVMGPENRAFASLTLTYIAVPTVFVAFLVVLVFSCYFVRRRRQPQKSTQIPDDTFDTTHTTSEFTHGDKSSSEAHPTSVTTTLLRTNFELSLPGYLMFDSKSSFRITKQIARGGGGVVSLAEALTFGLATYSKTIIVKNIGPEGSVRLSDLKEREQLSFKQEVAMMHYFRDEKYIAKLLGWSNSPPCILMKNYPLGSLDRWIYGKSYKQKSHQLQFVVDIARGILAIHAAGFVHCDLKPQNVLVDKDDQDRLFCCITDFGIAQIVDETTLLVKEFQVANVKGLSTHYAAPEAFQRIRRKGTYGNMSANLVMKVDLYSLGVIVFELLERQQPWRAKRNATS